MMIYLKLSTLLVLMAILGLACNPFPEPAPTVSGFTAKGDDTYAHVSDEELNDQWASGGDAYVIGLQDTHGTVDDPHATVIFENLPDPVEATTYNLVSAGQDGVVAIYDYNGARFDQNISGKLTFENVDRLRLNGTFEFTATNATGVTMTITGHFVDFELPGASFQ